jgi:Domain of unknown function (DUF4352)
MRAPLWLILVIVLAIVGLGVYAYFTTPLPLGLSSVIRTPGGSNVATPSSTAVGVAAGARTAAGLPLVLGATNVVIQSVQRNQDLSTGGRGPIGSFTLVQIELQNGGSDPLTPQTADFRLVDDRGRSYAIDSEATRSVNLANKHRDIFDATVPPGSRLSTLLAFETASDATGLTLRVRLGYGEVELPR